MDLYDAILQRHSVRSFSDKPVEKEKLDRILGVVAQAPTAVNFQAFKVFVIPTKEEKRFAAADIQEGLVFRRSVCAACLLQKTNALGQARWQRSYSDVDGAIIMDHIMLAATAGGWAPAG